MLFDDSVPPSVDSRQTSDDNFDPFAGPSIVAAVPSTSSQREIWLACKIGPDASCAFNESVSLEFQGILHIDALRRALYLLCERHDSLRATFSSDGETMCILDQSAVPVDVIDLELESGNSNGTSDRIGELLESESRTPFNLQVAPLLRGTLILLNKNASMLCLTAHHIVVDGWSFGVLLKDLALLYKSEVTGERRVGPPVTQFIDFAKQERVRELSPVFLKDEEYWKNLYRDVPEPLTLPGSGHRGAERSYNSRRLDVRIDSVVVNALKAWGATRGCSLFTSLLGACSLLLYRICGQSDVVIGVPTAGQAVAGAPSLIGHCVNTLPVRIKIDGKNSLAGHFDEVQKSVLGALDHQQYTLGTLLRRISIPRELNRPTLISVLFNLDRALPVSDLVFGPQECVALRSNPRAFENFELFLNLIERDGELDLECQYNTDLFTEKDIKFRIAEFIKILTDLPTECRQQVDLFGILPKIELDLLGSLGKGLVVPLDVNDTLIGRIEQNVEKYGDKLAVRCGERTRTYEQLWLRARQVAGTLLTQNCMPGDRVVVFLDRSAEYLESVLGIILMGGVYVPLDPLYPMDRLSHILENSGASLVVTDRELLPLLPSTRVPTILTTDVGGSPISCWNKVRPEDPLYLLYTSGTTGVPKGVLIPHRAALNFVSSIQRRPGLSSNDICLSVTTPTFDIWFLETVGVLAAGGSVVIADERDVIDGNRLLDLLQTHNVTVMQGTPFTWRLLLEAGWGSTRLSSQKIRALCGGESMPVQLMHDLLERSAELWNMYGPTEATVWASCKHLCRGDVIPSIGAPFDNTELLVLDSALQKVPVGAVGELFIGGDGLALGYFRNDALTLSSFIENPYGAGEVVPNGRLSAYY